MRYLVGLVLALALMAPPLSVSAQAGEMEAPSEPNLEEPAAPTEPAGDEGGLSPRLHGTLVLTMSRHLDQRPKSPHCNWS